MNQSERREINTGFGNAMSKAFELVVTPLIFAFLGYLVDGWLGTAPVFALTFGLFTFGYVAWKFFSGYEARMRDEEDRILKRGPAA